jgi:iron complex outermembrane receptor protein
MRLASFCYLALLAMSFPVHSQWLSLAGGPKVEMDIPSKPLDQALTDVGRRTDLVVIVDQSTGARDKMSASLKGPYTAEEAFHRLLDATGLQVRSLRQGTVLVTAQAPVTPPPPPPPPEPTEVPQKLEVVRITGTHFRNPVADDVNLTAYSRQDPAFSDAITVEQLVRGMPQNFPLLNSQTSTAASVSPLAGVNVARGEAMDLLGTGPGATLVLVNGLRVAPAGFDGSFVDVSLLPFAAIERVDVLTDGASAIYGSDAIAGVVNFVLRRDFRGLEVTPYSAVSGRGGRERGLAVLAGDQWDTSGFMASFEQHEQDAVNTLSRDTAAGPFDVVPAQKRKSGVLTMHQTLASWMELVVDGIGSERTFSQRYLSESPVSTQSQGRASLWGGDLDAVVQLPGKWHGEGIAAHTQEAETVTNSAESIAQSFRTRSSMTSADVRADGPTFSIAGGPIGLSVGGDWRRETFDDLQGRSGLARVVWGSYVEARVPIVGAPNARWWARRVEISLALRHDDYRHGGLANAASTNPKISVSYSPRAGLAARGSFATSFRMAPLAQLQESTDKVLLLPLSDPSAPGTALDTAYLTGGNRALRPEVAQSWTAGMDVTPSSAFKFSATYFWLDYRDRIAAPPVVGPVTSIYDQMAALRPYINSTPSAADVQALYDRYTVLDPASVGQGAIRAIFDSRLQNIAATHASGLEILATSTVPTDFGEFQFRLQGQYLAQLRNQAAPTTPYVPVLDTVFNASRWRAQQVTSWSKKGLTVSTNIDFTGSYKDTLVPGAPNVPSWFVVDVRVAYTTGDRFGAMLLDNTTIAIVVHNVMNRSPPYVTGLLGQTDGYDPSHASPFGRSIVFFASKRW